MFEKLLGLDQKWLLSLNHFANHSRFSQEFFKIIGVYLIYLIPVVLVILWFYDAKSKKVALKAALAGVLSWVVFAKIIAYIVRRPRPFEAGGVQEILFRRPDFSFPSDHAAFLFAIALTFWLSKYKKLAIFTFIIAILISIARIGLGVHYPGDILAGLALGLLMAWIIWLLERPLDYFYNFLINLAKKLRLS